MFFTNYGFSGSGQLGRNQILKWEQIPEAGKVEKPG